MADTSDLGSDAVRCAGSSPVPGTNRQAIRTNKRRKIGLRHAASPARRERFFGSSHFMVGLRLKSANNKHLAVSVGSFRTTYIRKLSSVQALRRY
jgi:hypothetical protein